MGRKSTRKYVTYNALEVTLRRAGFEKPGALTTLLLETFLENKGILTANAVKKAELCEDEGFKAWREPLIKAGWLEYDHELAKVSKKGSLHQAGKQLIPYVNKEIMKSQHIATKSDVESIRADYSHLEGRLQALESAFDSLIERVDPPSSPEKRRYYTANPGKLSLRMM